jgi:hypothetical protein
MATVEYKHPKFSLFLPPEPELDQDPVSTQEHLRNSFNSLNDQMFENMYMPDLKKMMTEISETCLNSLGQTFTCVGSQTELKSHNAVVNNNFFIGDRHKLAKITSVYVYACGDYVYKRSSFLKNDANCYFKLILEICLQNYALSLDCGLKIPAIIDCALLQNENYLSLEIKMERIDIINVYDEPDSITQHHTHLMQIIKSGLDCFEQNGLYHNDTHSDNIGFYKDADGNLQVVLMDFGKATLTDKNRYPSTTGFYKQLDSEDKFKEWLLRTIPVNDRRRTLYGGRKKRTRRNKKQRRQQKRKTQRRK